MNSTDTAYTRFALCGEMLATVGLIKDFDASFASGFVDAIGSRTSILLTGEGSSRIFPAKLALYLNSKRGGQRQIFTDGSTQALEYDLADSAVFGASNSGRTKELVRLFKKLRESQHPCFFTLTAATESVLEALATKTRVLTCGGEKAVAATKSVVEQALSYHAIFNLLNRLPFEGLARASEAFGKALGMEVPGEIRDALAGATKIYFAGRNNGVAEELALKTNEITRKKSAYLEGTYAVHGIEEVMDQDETLVIIEPFEEEEEKFESALVKGVGMKVVAVSTKKTRFPTLLIPEGGEFRAYVELAAGWNLLVETGMANNVALDSPRRARKVGNEFMG